MKRILVCILLVVQSITFLNACGNENTNLNPNDTNVSEKNVEETAIPTSTPMKKYSMEDVIDFLQQKSREIDEKTDTITIEPTYNTISGYQYFLFNTSDVYAKNSNKSEFRARLLQVRSGKEKVCMFQLYFEFDNNLNFEVKKITLSNSKEEFIISQPDIDNSNFSLYIATVSSYKQNIETIKAKCNELLEVVKSDDNLTLTLKGAGKNKKVMKVTKKQKESIVILAELWKELLDCY